MPLEVHSKSSEIGFGPHIPTYFTSLEEAQNSFCYHQNRCLKETYDLDTAVLRRNPASLLAEDAYLESYIQSRNAIREILHCWSSAFEAFLVKSSATMDSCWKMMHHLHDCMANTAHCMKETWHLGRSPT